jgi:hypothetical protein
MSLAFRWRGCVVVRDAFSLISGLIASVQRDREMRV